MVSVLDWSVTPGSNTTIGGVVNGNDMETINVDDLSRAIAAGVKSMALDISGATVTAGTANVQTFDSNGHVTALANGAMVSVKIGSGLTNTAATTLNVESLGAKAVVKFTTAGETALAGGELVALGHYTLQYNTALNGAAGAWVLLNPSFNGTLPFPATQLASADANTLDDYEEGTWTPALTIGGSAVGITFTTQTGRYTKIGRLVQGTGLLTLSSKGGLTGNVVVTGLLFTVGLSNSPCWGNVDALNAITGRFLQYNLSGTTVPIRTVTQASGADGALGGADLTDTSVIRVGFIYSV